MQEPIEWLREVPQELAWETARSLSSRALAEVAQTSKYHRTLFQPVLAVRHFLHQVTRGEHEAVGALLRKDIRLLFQRSHVTDCSGREFNSISGFEYALWALDKHMWDTMLAGIPQGDEGLKVLRQLHAQYKKVGTEGILYVHSGTSFTENHFDLQNTLIQALQIQEDAVDALGDKNWDAIDQQFVKGVGGAQKLLPMHVVAEYCNPENFFFVPKFTTPPHPSQVFYNRQNQTYECWYHATSQLGIHFAVYKGCDKKAQGRGMVGEQGGFDNSKYSDYHRSRGYVQWDLRAMKALYRVRTHDFITLNAQLKQAIEERMNPQPPFCTP